MVSFTSGKALIGALAVSVVVAQAAPAHANVGAERSATVRFAPPAGGTGYTGGSVQVAYAFLACFGELHVVYDVKLGSVRASDTYLLDGKSHVVTTPPPSQMTSIRLSGTV